MFYRRRLRDAMLVWLRHGVRGHCLFSIGGWVQRLPSLRFQDPGIDSEQGPKRTRRHCLALLQGHGVRIVRTCRSDGRESPWVGSVPPTGSRAGVEEREVEWVEGDRVWRSPRSPTIFPSRTVTPSTTNRRP